MLGAQACIASRVRNTLLKDIMPQYYPSLYTVPSGPKLPRSKTYYLDPLHYHFLAKLMHIARRKRLIPIRIAPVLQVPLGVVLRNRGDLLVVAHHPYSLHTPTTQTILSAIHPYHQPPMPKESILT